ncbi:MAG: hypothetical protein KJO40_13475 [Deltaproteobacteria bacterium]|nr:hypothetical protein [Deltaproteobacteria bacterium]
MTQDALKETFHVAGDQPDPAGTDLRGVAAGYDLTRTAIGHPMLHYALPNGKELILEADVYKLPGQPLYIYIICPLCMMAGHKQMLKIDSANKAVSYDPQARVPTFPDWNEKQMRSALPSGGGGLLSVDEFACTWEVEPELRRQFGFAVCPWRVVIEKNVVRNV